MTQKRIIVLRNSIVLPFSTTQITVTFKKYSRNERVNLRDLNRKDGLKYGSSKTKKTKKTKKIQLKNQNFISDHEFKYI